ncbi:MAG: Rne/Rng family ribonuclease [Alphaproteobacteria bacterium]
MAKRMLVDASHLEETRVVILDGNKVEEFDYESASRRPLKGNIYLAKVTRVEPSLQACFVEYGGNRHGFLAFSEIHPDYYQIPTADRQALLEAARADERYSDDDSSEAESEENEAPSGPDDGANGEPFEAAAREGEGENEPEIVEVVAEEGDDVWVHDPETGADAPAPQDGGEAPAPVEAGGGQGASDTGEAATGDANDAQERSDEEDALEEVPRRQPRSFRRYKIQEVIKRRQVLLIQVVKEERGNKGAALTTYLSLAGRYCVLMPNTDRGGGISRKISNVSDRRKLKEMASELEVPEGMGVIIRTAGANRTKQEIRRDFEYLLRQWDSVRDLTLRSTAPTLVYEEGNLIKRTIRDLYSKEIDEILVEGELGHREAHGFMSMLMPSHADSVKWYRDNIPLYQRYGVEAALDSMFNPTVRLRSGGYIVINQTEALVAIDVNSGKSTREHHIEDTALKTNLEAAEEIARQLRLRDLAGLVVIDFIDMEEHRNNRSVEKRLKDCLRHDRARIQLGRISPFGLLEMSRQRLRAGMIEGATTPCPHCEGRGVIRSVGSMALRVLRAIEEYCQHDKIQAATLKVPPEVALYILNHKRAQLNAIEERNGVYIYIESVNSLAASAYEIERGAPVTYAPRKAAGGSAVTVESQLDANEPDPLDEVDAEVSEASDEEETAGAPSAQGGEAGDGRNRRRRRRRRGRDRDRERGPRPEHGEANGEHVPTAAAEGPSELSDGESDAGGDADGDDDGEGVGEGFQGGGEGHGQGSEAGDGQRKRRRRGRRGRRGRRFGEGENQGERPAPASGIAHLPTPAEAFEVDWPGEGGQERLHGAPPEPTIRRPVDVAPRPEPVEAPAVPEEIAPRGAEARPERSSIASFFGFGAKPERSEPAPRQEPPPPVGDASDGPKKRGWWQKRADD